MESFLQRLERRFRGWTVTNLILWVVVGQVLVSALVMFGPYEPVDFALAASRILDGQIWRVFSFLLLSPTTSMLFLAIYWLVLFSLGNMLEGEIGSTRFTLFVGLYWFLNLLSGFVHPQVPFDNSLLLPLIIMSVGFLRPDYEILLFFIIPVKLKWVGLLAGVSMVLVVLGQPLPLKTQALATLCVFFLFFGSQMKAMAHQRQRAAKREKAVAEEAEKAFHTCSVCGATDKTHPDRMFFYEGGQGICETCANEGKTLPPPEAPNGEDMCGR